MVSTTRVRLPVGVHDAVLDGLGVEWGQMTRALHARLAQMARAGTDTRAGRNALKVDFCGAWGITARQYNALLMNLQGLYASRREMDQEHRDTTAARLKVAQAKHAAWEGKIKAHADTVAKVAERAEVGKPPTKAQAKRILAAPALALAKGACWRAGAKVRRLQAKLDRLDAALARPVPKVVFGSKRRLKARASMACPVEVAAWRAEWEAARSSQVYALGSADEAGGNQSCKIEASRGSDGQWDSCAIRVRLLGKEKVYLDIAGIDLHAHARRMLAGVLGAAERRLPAGRCPKVSFRFVRTGSRSPRLSPWEVHITVDEPLVGEGDTAPDFWAPEWQTRPVLGVDVNGDHLAWCLCAPDGNPLGFGRIEMRLEGKTASQRAAVLGDAARAVVALAVAHGARLACERLDFGERKRQMGITPSSARRNRALSTFPYAAVLARLVRGARRYGVPVARVNPAYTSVIGRVKHAPARGVSVHMGAALAIARRGLGYKEHYTHAVGPDAQALESAVQDSGSTWKLWGQIHRCVMRHDAVGRLRPRGRRAGMPPCPSASFPTGGRAGPMVGADGIPDFPLPPPPTATRSDCSPRAASR